MEEEEESIPQFESEFGDDQGDEADGWIPSTDAEIEEQVSLSCAEDGGPFSIKIEVPGHVDSDNEESAGHSESEEETENEQDQCEEVDADIQKEQTAMQLNLLNLNPQAVLPITSISTKVVHASLFTKNFLTVQQSNQISWQASAKLLGVSRATVYRRRRDFGMLTPIGNCYSNMSDDELDGIVRQILQTSPAAGERVLQNTLISRGLHIQRSRLRASVQRVDPKVKERRKCQPKKKIVKSKDACFVIHKNFLTVQQSNQISWQATARLLGVSRATVYRRRRDFGMLTPIGNRYSNMSDDELDGIVRQILQTSPAAANTDEGLNERFCESAFAQELSEDRKGISNGGNDPQSCSTSSGTKNIINSSMEDVSTQHQQVNLSTAELHQFNAEIQPGQGRIHRAIEAQMHPKEHGVLPTEEFSILKNILEGNNSSRNVTINSTNCPVCGQGFASPGDLDIHLKIHIQKSGNTSQDSAKNLPSINSHSHQKKVNTKKQFKCDSCDKLYASAKSLKRHQLLHSDNKQFKCRFCGKEFLSKNHLARHERVHTGEKPFECKYCLKKFSQKASLVGHEMVHTGEKPFTCRFCGKKFVQKISLIRHERIHTGEKPFKCKFCEKRFVQESNLICHERVHTNERPHSCNHCDKKFGRKYDLIKHEEIHAREIPFRMFASSILQNLIKTHTTA